MIQENVEIRTTNPPADATLVRPDGNAPHPAVIVLTDIWAVRPAYVDLAKKIADHGYVVLLPNIFYRSGRPPLTENNDFQDPRTKARIAEITAPLTPDAMERDGSAFVDFLASRPFVGDGPMGVVGFCYAGQFALRVAAARPDRIGAAASFHGGGLYKDEETSPHRVLARVKARLYFAHATNDNSMTGGQIEMFESALEKWGGDFASETYNARHGWMIPGREVFDPPSAERGFAKLIELFDSELKAESAV
jgi:carboxymethylenebutenolidase